MRVHLPHGYLTTSHHVYSWAFGQLSRALWLIFAGWLGMLSGIAIGGPILAANGKGHHFPGDKAVLVAAGVTLIAGFLANLVGKWLCAGLQRQLPRQWRLPGQHWLLCSLWCDFGSISMRWLAAGVGIPQLRLLAGPLGNFSAVFFLLFLRKIADVIERPLLKRLCELLLAVSGLLLLVGSATLIALAVRFRGPPVFAGIAATALLTLLGVLLYMVFLFLMASAAGQFSHYLKVDVDHDDDDELDVAEVNVESGIDLRVKSVRILNAPEVE